MARLWLLSVFGVFAWVATIASASTAGQSASFEIAEDGHPVGTASFEFAATAQGYNSSSLVKVAIQGLDYALSKTEILSASNELKHALVSATVNGEAVSLEAAPDSSQFHVNISASGKRTVTRLAGHSGAVLLPDFDPGALQTLLKLAVERNSRDLWVILPKQPVSIEHVTLATYPDQQGTLDEKPITVHHLVATIAGQNTEIFSGPENQLLQAELSQPGFALIRKGFVLTPSEKPVEPPVALPPAQPAAPN